MTLKYVLILLIIVITILVGMIIALLVKLFKNKNIINKDILTNLNNMYYLLNNYDQYVTKHGTAFIILIDFRKLKYINDNYGHQVGDTCLIAFSTMIKSYFTDSILIRRSGDEFIIVTSKSLDVVKELLRKVKQSCNAMFNHKKMPTILSFNGGIIAFDPNEDLTTLLEKADIAMYQAKTMEQLYMVYKDDGTKNNIIDKIDQAIADDQTKLKYVPIIVDNIINYFNVINVIIDLDEYRELYTNKYKKILSHSFRTEKLEIYVIKRVFLDIINHPEISNKPIYLTCGVATILFDGYDFLTMVKKFSINQQVNTNNIFFEIPINGISFDHDLLKKKLLILKDMGFNICLTNSNKLPIFLSFINTIPIDCVKIDQNIIVDGLKSNANYIIKMIDICKNTNIKIIINNIIDLEAIDTVLLLNPNIIIERSDYPDGLEIEKLLTIIDKK